MNLLWNSGLLA